MQYEVSRLNQLHLGSESLNGTTSANDQPVDCSHAVLPSTGEYYAGPLAAIVPVIVLGSLATIAIGAVYVSTMRYVQRHTPQVLRGYTSFVVSIYPVSASMALVSLLVPRTFPMVQLVMQGMFVVSFYQLFSLLVCHLDSREELSARLVVTTLQPATGPCCCCSCCRHCLKPIPVTRRSVMWIRILVLQLPLVQWTIYLATFTVIFERGDVPEAVYTATQVVFIASILLASWGTSMATGLLSAVSADFRAKAKFMALQAHVLLHALQSLIAGVVDDYLPCTAPLPPTLWINLTLSTLLLLEMVPLSLWARKLHCQETTPVLTLGYQPRRDQLSAVESAGSRGVNGDIRGPATQAVVTTQPMNGHRLEHIRDCAVNSITITT